MRRTLGLCLMALVFCCALAFAQTEPATSSATPGGVQTLVVAQGVPVREVAIGPQSRIFVTLSTPGNRVFEVLESTTGAKGSNLPALLPIAGSGDFGSLGDGGAATSAQLGLTNGSSFANSGMAVASDGSIFIADTQNSTIRRVAGGQSSEPGIIRSIAGRWAGAQNITLEQPIGIAADRVGNLYISDRAAGALDLLRSDTGALESLAHIALPSAIAVTLDGKEVFVASPDMGSVFAVDVQSRSMRTVMGPDSSSDTTGTQACVPNANPTQTSRPCPAGLAVDSAGNLFVSDATAGEILRFDARTGATSTVLKNLKQPGAIAFDEQGRNLYIAEQGANRLLVAQAVGAAVTTPTITPPGPVAFPNEPIGGTSAPIQFIVNNPTASPVYITSPPPTSAHANFSLQSTTCQSTLASDATCTISIVFTPMAVSSTLTSTISLSDSAGTSLASVTLSGTGTDYQLQFASGQAQELTVTAGNSATFNFQAVALSGFGQNGEKVSILCPDNLPAQTTCSANPAAVSPTVGSPAAFSLTFSTTAPSHAGAPLLFVAPGTSPHIVLAIVAILALAAVCFLFTSRRVRLPKMATITCLAVIAFAGCHHKATAVGGTPAGAVSMTVQGAATSSNGTPLNASRGLTFTLDVLVK